MKTSDINREIDRMTENRKSHIYILEMYDPYADSGNGESRILNVFSTMEKAIEYRDRYIREEYEIEDTFDGDLLRESNAEFFINKYQVL